MPVSIAKIASKIAATDVRLDPERTVKVRALRVVEVDAVQDAFPRPSPPYKNDPTKGSLSPPIQRADDIPYQRELRRWYTNVCLAEVALSIDLELSGETSGPFNLADDLPTREAWLRAAVGELKESMTEPEVRMLHDAMEKLGTVAMVKEAMKVLLVERDSDSPVEADIRIPQNYDTSETGLLLSAAARFGVGDPIAWMDKLEPGQRAMMLANELVRREEEGRRDSMLATACGVAGL